MRTHVEFQSDDFPAEPGEEEAINPGVWGHKLALYLRAALAERGVATGEPQSEDWGWILPIADSPFPHWIGCASYAELEQGFLCLIEPSTPTVWRWFRRVDTRAVVERAASALDEVLRSTPSVRGLRWWDEAELRRR